jgi:type III secretion system YopN/LcrE/InvE/MxiC family regulator
MGDPVRPAGGLPVSNWQGLLGGGSSAALRNTLPEGIPPAQLMAHSAEEITFQFSRLVEQSKKEAEAKGARPFSVGNWARVLQISKVRTLFEQITGQAPGVLAARAKQVIGAVTNSRDAYDAARELEPDLTLRYLILREAAHDAAKDPIRARAFETAIELVQEEFPGASQRIKADCASAPAIAASTPDSRLRSLLRETYRETLAASETPAEMALHFLEKYPEDEVLRAMSTLERAVSDDLKSPLVSRQPVKLEAILKDLRSIQTIRSAFALAEKILRAVVQKGGRAKKSAVRVATDQVRLAPLNPVERFITDVLMEHVEGDKALKLGYLGSCAQLFNALPSSIWPEPEHKARWQDCISDYLNREDPRDLKAV